MSLFGWIFGGQAAAPPPPPPVDKPVPPAAEKKDPLAPVRSATVEGAKLDLYDPLVLERISQAAKELQKSGWCWPRFVTKFRNARLMPLHAGNSACREV